MLRFKVALIGFVSLLLAPVAGVVMAQSATAATSCSYAACSKTDVTNGQYGLNGDDTQVKVVMGSSIAYFFGGPDSSGNHVYIDETGDFCTPKASDVPQISFSSSQWSASPKTATVAVWYLDSGGKCNSVSANVTVAGSLPADPGTTTTTTTTSASSAGTQLAPGTPLSTGSGLNSAPGCGAPNVANASSTFFFLPHWWEFMKTFHKDALGQCMPDFIFPDSLFPIGLAVVDILLRLAGFAAVIAVMISGVMYMTGQGNPDRGSAARKALFNSLIGLGIVFTASLAVTFIGNQLVH